MVPTDAEVPVPSSHSWFDANRRLLLVLLVAVIVGAGAVWVRAERDSRGSRPSAGAELTTGEPRPATVPVERSGEAAGGATTTTRRTTTTTTTPAIPADQTKMVRRQRVTGDISPKSVVASKHGIVFAQNMMYTHTVTAYDARDGKLIATIDDSVDLASFGIDGHPGTSQGAPVEAAFTRDGRYGYVSNYSMYGSGFGPEGADACTPASGYDPSFLYRIDTKTFRIDQVIPVGVVPKYVAVTPDQKHVLVSNWCSFDLSVVDTAAKKEVARIPIGRHPRGIVVSPDSTIAYVAVMGGSTVVKVDLASRNVTPLAESGNGPRHLEISPDGGTIYVSNNSSGTVARIDAATGQVTHTVSTGSQPRSMAISSDGSALYVVNYESSSVTKLRTSDLSKLDEVPTDHHPIGITYEPTTSSVWVANYGGSIIVLDDSGTAPGPAEAPAAPPSAGG